MLKQTSRIMSESVRPVPAGPSLAPTPSAEGNAPGRAFSRISIGAVQPKLTVNTPGDTFEQEADAMAENVIRSETTSPDPSSSNQGFGFNFSQVPVLSSQPVSRSVQRDTDPPDAGAPAPAPDPLDGGVADPVAGVTNPPAEAPPDAGPQVCQSPTSSENPDNNSSNMSIPQLSTPVNDALGLGLGAAGMIPGPIGTAATLAGGIQSATQQPTPGSSTYDADQMLQGTSLMSSAVGLGAAADTTLGLGMGLAGTERAMAAGPIGLGLAATGVAIHQVPKVIQSMAEGGVENNPGQFGPDPMDQAFGAGQGY